MADYRAANAFGAIPLSAITQAKQNLRFFYGHLSHGDQIINGMDMLAAQDSGYSYSEAFMGEYYGSSDPGREPGANWPTVTRQELAAGNYNVVMWAFSSNIGDPGRGGSVAYVNQYLAAMEQLEADFPNVTFVYFTGPARTGTHLTTEPAAHNKIIRDYAVANQKVLFDFESLELTDPDGNVHADGTDECEWCTTWCATHTCTLCNPCQVGCGCEQFNHTHCFQCYRKGQAFWYLAARLAGWQG